MNINAVDRREETTVELKYCERCGGLWLRRTGVSGVYCEGCRARLAELLRARRAEGLPERKAPQAVRIDWLQGVAEVRA